ncbi:carbohydrate esterase family 3 protein [Diaporthe amygdali]|uniref:carbohydrate esterase family 3 protein n=1 Tax=Phomopsis amygdali TaxID=1214568 RepID=UPI0022FF0B87|nr:carbohydrate esterase family 3 protein [Diaporthe amygdali]KAJ0118083.1 carbohydrate esterase family 3 protein [Diaporthe amygdali]
MIRSLRLMPLGGSVTFGSGSSNANGYREGLRRLLVDDGYSVEMVGSRRAGTMTNNHTEGWRGFRIDQIHDKARRSIPLLLPNVVAINAGSNDCLQGVDIEFIGGRMDSLLKLVWDASPGSTIVLSTLLANVDKLTEANVLRANAQYRELARRKAGEGRRIVLVDMHTAAGPSLDDLMDGTHPNDLGYHKMALLWRKGIQECASKGLLQEPIPKS